MSYVIHEIDLELREEILRALSHSADKIIMVDYLHPKPNNISGRFLTLVEFLAGRDHYNNFKTYMANDGLKGLANTSGLKIIKEIRKSSSGTHIAVMKKL